MIVELRFDLERPRAWMNRLATLLGHAQLDVQIAWVKTDAPRPAGLESLFELERMLLRNGRPGGADAMRKEFLRNQRRIDRTPDIVVDFTGVARSASDPAQQYLRPLYDGAPGEDAALAAILCNDLPVIEIRDEIDGGIVDAGQPSAEVAEGLSGALDTVMARTTTMLVAVLSGGPRLTPRGLAAHRHGQPRSPAEYVFRGIAHAVARSIYRLCCYSPHWRIGWRHTDDDGVWGSGNLTGPRWNVLSSPANRFYADPFGITWNGRTVVFFEDLDHRVGKGIISAVEFDERGPKGPVSPVLEESWHQSYPFLLTHGGDLWMIPESTENRDVALYRCTEFPGKWERHTTLLSGLELADVTIVPHGGLYYMFGASRDGAGGYSDTLSIYYARDLFGPWLPHASNPVLIDRTCARPAGNFINVNGQLRRPVQDCTRSYGGALNLADVLELSPTTFRQVIRHSIQPGQLWPGRKLHTLNRCGRLELIDGASIQPRIAALLTAAPIKKQLRASGPSGAAAASRTPSPN